MQSISVFLDITKLLIPGEKKKKNSGGVSGDSYVFLIFFR